MMPCHLKRWGCFFSLLIATACGCGGGGGGSGNSEPVFVHANLNASRFSLNNGLEVILQPDKPFRDVVVNVRYNVGSKDDPRNLTGLAHFVEHLTFRSKPDRKRDAFTLLELAGSTSHNASTTRDFTEYFDHVPGEAMPLALFVEAARMARPLDGVDETVFGNERKVVENERLERYDNVAYGKLAETVRAKLLVGHPYEAPPIGSLADLERAKLSDVATFVSEHYRPNNATLVITGGFDPARAKELVHALFDAIPGGAIKTTNANWFPQKEHDDAQIKMEAGVDAPAVAIGWLVPPAGAKGASEIRIAGSMIAGYVSYHLHEDARRVVVENDYSEGVSAFIVRVELSPNGSTSSVTKYVDEELDYLTDVGRDVLLNGHKSKLIATTTLGLEGLERRANVLQDLVSHYDDPNSLQTELHAYSEVTRGSLADVTNAYLRKGRRVTAIVRPVLSAPKAGRVQ